MRQMSTHVVVVLLEEDELFLEGLNLAFKVHAVQVGVIDDLSQAGDVGLNTLADGQLRFIPSGTTKVNGSLFLVKTRKLPMRSKCLLRLHSFVTHLTLKSSAARRALSIWSTRRALFVVASKIYNKNRISHTKESLNNTMCWLIMT